tara:strand:- start:5799 stop:6656 length:858 start_codon:yes stop_codon:yes gene_type:complete
VQTTNRLDDIGDTVREFYREMPFNIRRNPEDAAEKIRKVDSTRAYSDLYNFIVGSHASTMVEIGCGVGHLSNSVAYHHKLNVSAIDFNDVAINEAKETAHLLGVEVDFLTCNLFDYMPDQPVPLAISIGVLHHTADTVGAIQHIAKNIVAPGGVLYLGLYHTYGRRPFLEHFAELEARGVSEEDRIQEFSRLLGHNNQDIKFLTSWYRDQVLHPFESQHTAKEIVSVINEVGFIPVSTSINKFEKVENWQNIFDLEKKNEDISRAKIKEHIYYPGFFTLMSQKES